MSTGTAIESGSIDCRRTEPSAPAFMAAAGWPSRRLGQVPLIDMMLASACTAHRDFDALGSDAGSLLRGRGVRLLRSLAGIGSVVVRRRDS